MRHIVTFTTEELEAAIGGISCELSDYNHEAMLHERLRILHDRLQQQLEDELEQQDPWGDGN